MAQYRTRTKVYGIISAVLLIATVVILILMPASRAHWSPVIFFGISVDSFKIYSVAALAIVVFFLGQKFKKWAVKDMDAAGITGYSRAGVYGYWVVNSLLAFVLFIMPISIPKAAGLSLESRHLAAIRSVNDIQSGCYEFNHYQYGLSDELEEKYYGYPRQTQDFLDAILETSHGSEKIYINGVLCAKEGEDGIAGGYYFRYTVLIKHKDELTGLMRITDYMICAWPKEIGKSGVWVIIANSSGKMYKRVLDRVETREEMLITEWPLEDELAKNWEFVTQKYEYWVRDIK